MRNIFKLILQIKAVHSMEIDNKTMRPKPHLKIVVSKNSLKDGDINLIYKLLHKQNYYEWTVDMLC